jgi:hypothetical protein
MRGIAARLLVAACALAAWPAAVAPQAQLPFDAQGRPNRTQPGPWDNDVLVYRAATARQPERLAAFPRAGVPTAARLPDGRIIAAHQHFPEDDDEDFDKVAVRFSSDEGRTWTRPEVIRVTGLPEGARFPFDPTLVPLPDGRVRLYFTFMRGRRLDRNPQVIASALSSNGVDFAVEPGVRFAIEGRPVIDCAVVLHGGMFHLFAPDNGPIAGAEAEPAVAPTPPQPVGRSNAPAAPAVGYHATSPDGLTFTRQDDVYMEGDRRWLGNALSDDGVIRFFGTGPGGVWTATSEDGATWLPEVTWPVPGADPGAVRLRDGSWLIVATGKAETRQER